MSLPLQSRFRFLPRTRERAKARWRDPATSKEAALWVDVSALEVKILMALYRGGAATTEQLAERTAESLVSVSPRMKPLAEKGYARDSGRKGKNRSGRLAILWELVPPEPPARQAA